MILSEGVDSPGFRKRCGLQVAIERPGKSVDIWQIRRSHMPLI